jgi:aspartyl-tRNA(Asn)/glutamyl-tRNA(Gln) amidotransferase subunit A
VGPIARSVEDVAMVLDALAGGAGVYVGEATAPRRRQDRARIGVPRRPIEAAAPDREIAADFEQALEVFGDLGVDVIDVEVEGLADAAAADFVVLNAEAFTAHERTLRAHGRDYGPSARAYHLQGAFLSAADYIAAREVGDTVRGRLDRLFSDVDALATPVAPFLTSEAARASKAHPGTGGVAIFTAPFNLTGHPALAVPCGMSAAGMPIGLQLVGRAGGEGELLRLAGMYEQATPWHTMHPTDVTLAIG